MPWPSRRPHKPPPQAADPKPYDGPTCQLLYEGAIITVPAAFGARAVRHEIALAEVVRALQADPAARMLSLATRNIIDQAAKVRFPNE